METLTQLYRTKCSDFACDPLNEVLELMGVGSLETVSLDGRSKTLFNNRVKPMQVFALCETLYEYNGIRVLRLPFNFLNDVAAQALARLIQVNKGLQLLDLTGNEVTAKGVAALKPVLSRPDCALQALILRSNPVGDEGMMALAEVLKVNKSLSVLDLADTRAGVQGLLALSEALADGNTTLRVLDIEDALLQSPQLSTYQHMSRMLAANSSLTELSLAKHRMVDSQLEQLVTYGFRHSGAAWESLSFRANRLSPFAGPLLERLLSHAPRLQRLNLASNALGCDGAVGLARGLGHCPGLRELDVRANAIGEAGMAALAAALPHLRQLELFAVWGNTFGPGACAALAEALAHPALSRLRTDVRPYEVDGRVQLALQEL